MVNKNRRHTGRDQDLIIFFGALSLILIYFIHKPHNLGSSNSLKVIEEKDKAHIEVSGEVKNPGIYDFPGGVTVYDAIKRAGGLKDGLIIDRTFHHVRLKNGEKITARRISREMGGVSIERMDPKKFIILSIPIDVNTATLEDLLAVPGVGPRIAQRIINYRERNEGFSAIEELKGVKGIGKVKYERIKEYIVIN